MISLNSKKKGSLGHILNKVKFQQAVWKIGKDAQAVFYKEVLLS